MGALATIAISLGMAEAAKLLNDISSLKPGEAQSIAQKILTAAEKKGSQMLNKAMNAIQSIPAIAGSPAIKAAMTKARQSAENNYQNVENSVNDMKTKANDSANKISDIGNESIITKAFKFVKGEGTAGQRAENVAKDATQGIENWKIEQPVGGSNG